MLRDAHYLEIPGSIAIKDASTPLVHFGVDRSSLLEEGLGDDVADRVYSALFVYSVGFNTMIRELMHTCHSKYSISSKIWKVFSMLLEYCAVLDYKHIITEIDTESKINKDKLEAEFEARVRSIEASN